MSSMLPKMQKIKPYGGQFLGIEHPLGGISEHLHTFAEEFDEVIAQAMVEALQDVSEEYAAAIRANSSWPAELADELEIWIEDGEVVLGFRDEAAAAAFDAEMGAGFESPAPVLRSGVRDRRVESRLSEILSERFGGSLV